MSDPFGKLALLKAGQLDKAVKIKTSDIESTTDANKIQLTNLASEVIETFNGVGTIPPNLSVSIEKLDENLNNTITQNKAYYDIKIHAGH